MMQSLCELDKMKRREKKDWKTVLVLFALYDIQCHMTSVDKERKAHRVKGDSGLPSLATFDGLARGYKALELSYKGGASPSRNRGEPLLECQLLVDAAARTYEFQVDSQNLRLSAIYATNRLLNTRTG
jgi:hypothetical protein